ncbi:PilZ domain-containing protein [Brevibacillus agri]|uniref:PilZ domain-containing protein n=1 Tax=Brevibacillus agri TaxID=51101 RepID=UPI00286FD56C|nr:PilZ domain-containing protein [Brevibacillus agri]MDR9504464.1 PilZ domain-containing protein [Brevibacillus agri]
MGTMAGRPEGNRREHFRLKLEYPLCADMTIVLVKGRTMEIGSSKVLVQDIGARGLCFLSHLKMPASDQLVLQFEMKLCAVPLKIYGHVVRSRLWEQAFYEYGVFFTMDEIRHLEVSRLVNLLAIRYRQNRGITEGNYWKGDRQAFLRELALVSQTLETIKA